MPNQIKNKMQCVLAELEQIADLLDGEAINNLVGTLTRRNTVFIAGAGRSGFLLRCFAMRLMHMGQNVHMIGDVTTPAAKAGDTLLIGSGSGETASLVSMAKKAKVRGMTVSLITTNPKSTIAKLADAVAVIPAPTPKAKGKVKTAPSSQPMGNLFEQSMFLVLDCVVMLLMEKNRLTSDMMFARHANLE